MATELKEYTDVKDVPRPAKGNAAMFIHVLESGEKVLTCLLDDGRTVQMMSSVNTAAQLEAMKHKR
jgi:hypothetical protein